MSTAPALGHESAHGDLVIAISPGSTLEPSPRIAVAATSGGGLGVVDLAAGGGRALGALRQAASWAAGPVGARVPAGSELTLEDLDRAAAGLVNLLIVPAGTPWLARATGRYRTLVEVTSLAEAREAAAAGAHGLIARGMEAGGVVGELSSFVLTQQLLADGGLDLPVWVCGGVGPHTAAACAIAGARGVVLDSQLALMPESDLPDDVLALVRRMDGSETVLDGRFRGVRRGGRPNSDAQLLPIGQDGWLAGPFAQRWRDTAAAVRGIAQVMRDAVADEDAGELLAPGAPLAETLGIRVPVAQGPMTRVSDEAPFAAAVAADGGLPFIALALADGERSRQLLRQASEALRGRPWGVGVLGFVPEELRLAQIAAVQEVRPDVAIIAGGRPAQATALEADGISTYLHVPSPGLLRQFLRAGSRKFVFEGAECGGHVGPRASFPLWEAQLLALEEFLDGQPAEVAAQIQVFFAGGIHDERSAAMVCALASGLARRGARIGVLMGTAYLFTREAVECGAIQPLFQREAIAAEATCLLETAPGHATRCLPSPFVDDFRAMQTELERAGVQDRQVWERLEMLNVGRLRIASKGRRREGGEVLAVDEATQAAEGLFMAGQVAVLRAGRTTVADLHAAVTTGARDFHRGRTRRPEQAPAPAAVREPLDIAIVGMACVFPNSPDLASFWHTVLEGADAITEVPAGRWDVDTYYAPEVPPGRAGRVSVSRWGGFIAPVPFDALRYGIPPAALSSIDPTQLLALEVSYRALVDAGYPHDAPGADHTRTGVVFGADAGSDMSHAQTLRTMLPAYLGEVPDELAEQLPTVTEDSFPGVLANVIAGRVANRLDLGGPNFTVDAACASSLAAMDAACKELVSGSSDLMLCGGADLHNGINDFLMFTSAHALSPTGRCRTFDSTGDGIALGEGVACVVLKRLADARRDHDRVYAVIKGLGASSDGRALGLTAPRAEGQRRALDRAYQGAGVSPREVGLVEAHGTGTVVGDRTELEVLTRLFTEAGAEPGSCALGSVKSQIGHTKCAAGLAGVIKAALALHTGVRPPTINLSRPNPAWDPERSPFAFYTKARPWTAPAGRRLAGISAFGFGGTNYHVVLAAHAGGAEPRHARREWPAELFCLRGTDREAARREAAELLSIVDSEPVTGRAGRLRELATAHAGRSAQRGAPVRIAIVARDTAELAALLRRALAGEHDPSGGLIQPEPPDPEAGGKVAFLFPGQGSQRAGALAELFVSFPELRHYLDLGSEWAGLLYPPSAFDERERDRQEALIRDTRVAQPVLGIGGLAVDHLLRRLGVRPDLAAGHSYGELVALCVADAFDPETLLALSRERADAILAAAGDDPGTMAAAGATAARVDEVLSAAGLAGQVVIANHNAPSQVVISGATRRVRAAVVALKEAGVPVRDLPVACAFHSPVVAGAVQRFARVLADRPVAAPRIPVWSNRTARPYPTEPSQVRDELARQIGAPVRFVEQIEAMYAAGARVFVEAGPGRVLTRLAGTVLEGRPHLAVAVDGRPGGGLRSLLIAAGELACAGVPVQTGWLFRGRDSGAVPAPVPGRPLWTIDGQLVRDGDGNSLPGGMTPPRRIKEPFMTVVSEPGPGAQDGRDELVTEFLRTSRELIASHREVMLAYFGGAARGRLVWQPGEGYPAASVMAGAPPAPVIEVPAAPVSPAPAYPAMVSPAPAGPPAQPAVAVVAPTMPAAPVTAPAVPDAAPVPDFNGAVLAVISERTGYPTDLIDPDLDLEADLSIDSIKRAEVAGEVATRLALPTDGDPAELEDLVKARTVRSMVEWLTAKVGAAAPVSPAPAPSPAVPAVADAAPVPDFNGAVLAVISERTGYPTDLIDPDLDLEADLSIDSIKRAEVAGEVATRLALPTDGDPAELEDLVKARTVRAMVEWLTAKVGAAGAGAPEATDEPVTPSTPDSQPVGRAPVRMVTRAVPLTGTTVRPASALDGTTWMVTGDCPAAARLAEMLRGHGATVRTGALEEAEPAGADRMDGLVMLDGLVPARTMLLPGGFPLLKRVLTAGTRWVLAATAGEDGERTDGIRGLFRTIGREYPGVDARAVDVPAGAAPEQVARALLDELLIEGQNPVVLRRPDGRYTLDLVAEGLGVLASGGAGPAGDGAAEAAAAGLDRDSVVVLIGGARGITPWFARALAAASGCRLELVGRTPAPDGPEDPELAQAVDKAALCAALARRGMRSAAEIDRTARAALAGREVAASLRELRELGAQARYHVLDVRDEEAVHRLLKEIHGEYRRIDGLVYAAGVIEDKLIADKDPESFARVFSTKVDGARGVLAALSDLPEAPRFTVLFGSIAAAFGNRGQADYAAGNDAVDAIGGRWARQTGNRCLTVHWGPWAPAGGHAGMVGPELSKEYARRGIALIDPEEGALSLLRELAWGDPASSSVVYTASGW